MKELLDIDLDIYNILKDLPHDQDNAVIYIRISDAEDLSTALNTALMYGTNGTMIKAVINAMTENKDFAGVIKDAAELYCKYIEKKIKSK